MDPAHILHERAHVWFAATGQRRWASCPLIQNGVIRILSHPRYPNTPGPPAAVMPLLADLISAPGHEFWPDDISLLHLKWTQRRHLLQSAQVTDGYLLALALAHGGKLASFDTHLPVQAVLHGADALHLIP